MRILIVAAEAVPFAKVGGLADVTGALPKALKRLGHDVRLAIPKYQRIQDVKFDLRPVVFDLQVPMDSHFESALVKEGSIGGDIPVYLIDSARYFQRAGVYGYPDDDERFVFFSRAALEMLPLLGWTPDVVHCHDWHTAIIPNWLNTLYRDDDRFNRIATLFTIHNLSYHGIFGNRVLEIAGIGSFGFSYADPGDNAVDLLGRGLHFADAINTVSEQYAREIQTPELGEGMEGLLRERSDRLLGILNGLDDELDPSTDRHIAAAYGVDSLDRRVENKLALQREANLKVDAEVPLIGMISRLAGAKGFDILCEALPAILRQPLQMVILGTGEQRYHEELTQLAKRHRNLALFLTFNTPLAQKIYAGSDMFLMPSRFEPCGLGQLIAMRYGSVPIVRRTGGLADTVLDFDPRSAAGNGFVFEPYEPMDLFGAVVRALETYKYTDTWRRLVEANMRRDFSWAASAQKYVEAYERAMELHAGAGTQSLPGSGVSPEACMDS
ncbi:MAG TPA: glycogen synthase [Chloroflexota bacterium]|nr:glycogen synthase [Chloroflexota bacterium]